MTDETYNATQAMVAQQLYCTLKGSPQFAPYNGQCPTCGFQIYDSPNGYSVEYASTHMITGCPYCRRSFVD